MKRSKFLLVIAIILLGIVTYGIYIHISSLNFRKYPISDINNIDIYISPNADMNKSACVTSALAFNYYHASKVIIQSEQEYSDFLNEIVRKSYEYVTDGATIQSYISEPFLSNISLYKYYCSDFFQFPNIDFSKYTLLGNNTTGGCSDFKKEIVRDDVNKTLTYTLKVVNNDYCSVFSTSNNWVLVDKLPADYQVIFKVL